jgi:hypothetical protein
MYNILNMTVVNKNNLQRLTAALSTMAELTIVDRLIYDD